MDISQTVWLPANENELKILTNVGISNELGEDKVEGDKSEISGWLAIFKEFLQNKFNAAMYCNLFNYLDYYLLIYIRNFQNEFYN